MGLFGKKLKGIKDTVAQLSALQEQAKVFAAAQGYGPDGQPLAPDAPRPPPRACASSTPTGCRPTC